MNTKTKLMAFLLCSQWRIRYMDGNHSLLLHTVCIVNELYSVCQMKFRPQFRHKVMEYWIWKQKEIKNLLQQSIWCQLEAREAHRQCSGAQTETDRHIRPKPFWHFAAEAIVLIDSSFRKKQIAVKLLVISNRGGGGYYPLPPPLEMVQKIS